MHFTVVYNSQHSYVVNTAHIHLRQIGNIEGNQVNQLRNHIAQFIF